jgi:prepilin-type N-terminal cleavage/methylation domain-containing protein
MSKRWVRGFTLVELLVVIAIIGTLVALLLPAVQRARESSRRASCLNNLRQLALATMEFDDRYRRFPGLFDELPIQQRSSGSSERFSTWAVLLLPDLEREAIFNQYAKGNRPLPDIYIEPFLCPSDAVKPRSGSVLSYVANGGKAGSSGGDRPSNGPFMNRALNPKAAVMEGHWRDGKEYTFAYTENKDAMNYDIIGWSGFAANPNDTNADPIDRNIVSSGSDRVWSPVFLWQTAPTIASHINGPIESCNPSDVPPCLPEAETGRYKGSNCTVECRSVCSLRQRPRAVLAGEHRLQRVPRTDDALRQGIRFAAPEFHCRRSTVSVVARC